MQMFVIFSWMHHNHIQETRDNGNNQNTTKLNKLFNRLLLELIISVHLSSFFISSLSEVLYQSYHLYISLQNRIFHPMSLLYLLTLAQRTQSTFQGNHWLNSC